VVVPATDAAPLAAVAATTRELIERRRRSSIPMRRGWMMRRALLLADVAGLTIAFVIAGTVLEENDVPGHVGTFNELLVFVVSLPFWLVLIKLHGLYDRDEERADHTTVDDLVGVLHVVTLGTWLFLLGSWATGLADPRAAKLGLFWILAVGVVTAARAGTRALCRRSDSYVQNALIVGTGKTGQLLARKLLQHPEYGITVVGFVDDEPIERRPDVAQIPVLGPTARLASLVTFLDVERVIFAFSTDPHEATIEAIRSLRELDVQVEIVPRLFEVLSPAVGIHTVETFPLVVLPALRPSPSSQLLKRTIDIAGASLLLLATAPLFAVFSLLIKRGSPGPVLFRQTRVGLNQREFTALKFRTMRVGTDDALHRRYIEETMNATADPQSNGLYKLERSDAVTDTGRWLRKTSLDELPQLLNVLRGDMSLVGPRPCLAYETEHFLPHHFERFLVPPGVTGLWQVSARAKSTFREALDMDVAYVRGWSLGLDLRLLFRTPVEVLRQRRSTA
jgi:exopolysaccharide biosynthesis polyprenyl glycosylphosphotransferase